VWQQQVDDTIIRAPFTGIVTSKNAQPGEMISPMSSGGFTRTGICTIVDMESLEIEIDVNESYINRVTVGQPVEAVCERAVVKERFDAGADGPIAAKGSKPMVEQGGGHGGACATGVARRQERRCRLYCRR